MAKVRSSKVLDSAYIIDLLISQNAMLQRISDVDSVSLIQVAEIMGEIGARYLSISEKIRSSSTNEMACENAPYPVIHGVWSGIRYPHRKNRAAVAPVARL